MRRGKILSPDWLGAPNVCTHTRKDGRERWVTPKFTGLFFVFFCRSLTVEPAPEVTRSRRSPATLPGHPSPPGVNGHQFGVLGNQELSRMREGTELSPDVEHIRSFSLFLNKNVRYIQYINYTLRIIKSLLQSGML